MRRCFAPLVLAGLSLVVACGGGEEDSAPPAAEAEATAAPKADETVAFKLREENRSGSAGSATLEGGDDGFTVVLKVKRTKDYNPAHIHSVTCDKYRSLKSLDEQIATVGTPLTDLEDGSSKSLVTGALSEYRTGQYSINVHSTKAGFPAIACGDIPPG